MSTEIKTPNLEEIAANYKKVVDKLKRRIIICGGTGCIANGSMKVRDAICAELEKAGEHIEVVLDRHDCSKNEGVTYFSKSGCQGFCQMGPILRIEPEGIFYCHVKPEDAAEIVHVTLIGGEIIDRLVYVDPVSGKACRHEDEIAFYARQTRVVLANYMIEPDDVEEYIAREGYIGARKAITEMTPEQVCQTMIDAGLRGRGGGGFPTGLKWKFTLASQNDKKYVICNGDEGDPGAFMDRSVMEGNPHAVLEGMMIAGRAIGADEGVVYVRAEYPLAVERIRKAIADAEEYGLLGKNLFGTDFNFTIRVMEGAGAFVCGEETALIASVEGKRGMPMPKPPFPAQKGLYGKPTVINNVETLASVAYIIRNGAEKYREVGPQNSPGTKTFALTGHVANTGLIEVPFGTTLREIVYNIGGGVTDNTGKVTGEDFKSVQIGGPSGGCLVPDLLDLPLDFDSLKSAGAMVGSGGLVVMNKQTCMVRIARFFRNARPPREDRESRPARLPLRPRQDRPEPGPLHPALFPQGVRRPRVQKDLPDRRMQGARPSRDRPREVQRLHGLRPQVPRRRDHRQGEGSAPHRPRKMHQVRRVQGRVQVRRSQGNLKTIRIIHHGRYR